MEQFLIREQVSLVDLLVSYFRNT